MVELQATVQAKTAVPTSQVYVGGVGRGGGGEWEGEGCIAGGGDQSTAALTLTKFVLLHGVCVCACVCVHAVVVIHALCVCCLFPFQPLFVALSQIWCGFQDEVVLLSVLSNLLSTLVPFTKVSLCVCHCVGSATRIPPWSWSPLPLPL